MCNHRTCKKFNKWGNIKGVGALFLHPHYRKNGINVSNAVLLGHERGGSYKGKYNLCGGKMDKLDSGCVISAIIREVMEEFKMDLTRSNDFDSIFRGNNGFIRCFTIGNTLIFVGFLPSGFSRQGIKAQMIHDCRTHDDSSYREMDDVELFNPNNFQQIEGKNCNVSSYAASAIQQAAQKGFI